GDDGPRDATPARIVYLAPASAALPQPALSPCDDPLDTTLGRIADLCTHEEATRAMTRPTVSVPGADHRAGDALTALVDELDGAHAALAVAPVAPAAAVLHAHAADDDPFLEERDETPLEDLCQTRDLGAALGIDESIAALMRETERRISAEVERAVTVRSHRMQREYDENLARLRAAASRELAAREARIRASLEHEYLHKEQLLRAHYKKLMAFADTLGRRQLELRAACQQFEDKLGRASQLYGELTDLSPLLDELP
ncbi:MAG: hypothetical protein RLW62_17125, partial [Gammaproteobacteria bacterium]